MKVLAVLFTGLVLTCPSSIAQTGNNSTDMTIGPNGITINSNTDGKKSNVRIGPNGITVDQPHTKSNVKITPGAVSATQANTNVKITPDRITTNTNSKTTVKVSPGGIANTGTRTNTNSKSQPKAGFRMDNSFGGQVDVRHDGTGSVSITQSGEVRTRTHGDTSGLGDIVLNDNNARVKGFCNSNSIVVNANNCQFMLTGTCAIMTINGNNNHINAENIGVLNANGNGNSVTWAHGSKAKVFNSGNNNNLHSR